MKKETRKIIIISAVVLSVFLICLSIFVIKDKRQSLTVENFMKEIIHLPSSIFKRDVNLVISEEVVETSNSELNNDIAELKELLDINTINSKYEYINSTIISRDSIKWYDTLTIDKGKYSGIKKGMAVINGKGFIGEVMKVTSNYSEVKLITSSNFPNKISVSINKEYGVTTEYDKKKQVLFVDGVDNLNNIKEGDKVVTSGLSSIYPSGILIGEVVGFAKDEYNIEKYIKVKLSADIKKSHYCSVVKK